MDHILLTALLSLAWVDHAWAQWHDRPPLGGGGSANECMGTGGSPQVFVFRLPPLDRALYQRRPFGAFMNWASCAPYDFGKRRRASELRTLYTHLARLENEREACTFHPYASRACTLRESIGRAALVRRARDQDVDRRHLGPSDRRPARSGGAHGAFTSSRTPSGLPHLSLGLCPPKEGRGRKTEWDQVKVCPW